jgi:type IV pilus assembly protein PilY1
MTRVRASAAVAAAAASLLTAGAATAQQIDTNPPLPNVMLLVDNSGSMERMIDGNTPEQDGNSCNCTDNGPGNAPSCPAWSQATPPAPPAPNRWAILQTALTGSLTNGFNCVAMPRSPGSTFDDEYKIGGNSTYDVNYYLPFHRMVAEDKSSATPVACVAAPGGLPGGTQGSNGVGPLNDAFPGSNATDYPAGAIGARQYGKLPGFGGPAACTSQTSGALVGFPQNPDGALKSMRDLMRFGLMTFDTDTDPDTGVTASNTVPSAPSPFLGMWTYFPGWSTNPTGSLDSFTGNPANCTSPPTVMGVGARNPGAPPWEGRLVGFPAQPDLVSQEKNNDEVAQVMLASRPYGATPTAGLFQSAKYYFWTDPTGPQQTDNYVKGLCRNEYIIFLTDGAPNLDLQPSCSETLTGADGGAGTPGKCPFSLPYSSAPLGTAATLYNNGQSTASQASVKTYVIGFAVSSFTDNTTPVQCSQFATGGALASQCNCNDPNLPAAMDPSGKTNIGPCCVLQCLARNGGTNSAYFANNQGDLTSALNAILADIAQNATTRTTPAYSSVVTNVLSPTSGPQVTNESIFLASFNPSPGKPWSGDIQRQRYQCTYSGSGFTIPTPTIQTTQGDDFGVNLNSGSGPPRTFIAYQPATVSGTADATATIRPYAAISGGDGIGQYKATLYVGPAAAVDTNIAYATMGIQSSGCQYTSNVNGAQKFLAPATCATMLLDYTFGQSTFNGIPNDFTFTSRAGNALGSIYHATPAVVGPPGTLLQDPGYVGFAAQASPGWGARKNIVYAATNDGLLHAFWSDETKLENNEMWAMLLPGVMPSINGGSYPSSQSFLLDGAPVVKDVVWDRSSATSGSGSTSSASDPTAWHTMLVAGYGASQTGYYAVDVTNPDPTGMASGSNPPVDPAPVGPVFRWQLTKMPSTNMPLFGSHSSTPAITTLFMDPHDGGGTREIGVAILSGGEDVVPSTQASCQRWPKTSDSAPVNSYAARTNVRCWSNPTGGASQKYTDMVVGRSVSIVRLDTGEILHVFARKNDFQAYPSDTLTNVSRYTDVALDSPMTGTPVVYPSDVGTDTTKFWVSDADGTIWRFDVSDPEPANWFGELYLDLYNQTVDTGSTPWSDGQPVQVPPVLSLDPAGEIVLNVASGTTDQFDTTGTEYVYSITEKVTAGTTPKLRAYVNWWMQPAVIDNQPGERVSGPMTVFNGTLYFSTYAAATPGTQSCSAGVARLWGRDFVTPDDSTCTANPTSCNRSIGGLREMQPPPPNPAQSPAPVYIEPDLYDSTLQGKVIPGVSIKSTPACASLGNPGPDSYVAGASHASPQNYTQGGYSLFTQVGAKGTNGATTRQFETPVPTPVSPTLIDSWAAVLE